MKRFWWEIKRLGGTSVVFFYIVIVIDWFYIPIKLIVLVWPGHGKPNLVSLSAGMVAHVMTFEVGAVLDDAHWQAPVYCFSEADDTHKRSSPLLDLESRETFMSEMARFHAYAK